MHPFRLAELPPQPWRNGGGVTREILVHPSPRDWIWRVSLADNKQPGPFSPFPGVERAALLFDGGPLELHGQTGEPSGDPVLRFGQPGDIRRFAGEAYLRSHLPHGPARLLNAMTRRGAAHAELAWHAGMHGGSLVLHEHQACVLLAASGRWHINVQATTCGTTHELDAGSGLHIAPQRAPIQLRVQALDAHGSLAQVVLVRH
jgi:environmental stress-induced protein Ves